LAKPEIERKSGREITPNPMFNLITIYDNEDSSEVSLITLVKITEEIEHEKESTPGLNASIQIHLQNEHEVESALDIEPLNI
jgi:hypothetical protein